MKAIFFDTNVFYDLSFNIDDERMTKVVSLAKRLNVSLWTSVITVEEIKAGIDRRFNDLLTAYDKAMPLLKNTLDDQELFNRDKVEFARDDTKEQLDLFIEQNDFLILKFEDLDEADIAKSFQDYFLQKGVFTPKKRSKSVTSKEFPDSFQVEMIKRAARCNDTVSVVSSDGDFTQAFSDEKNIDTYRSLEQLYKVLSAQEKNKEIKTSLLENRVMYFLDEHETARGIYSCLNFHESVFSMEQILGTLSSLCKKQLVDAYVYCQSNKDYILLDRKGGGEIWYKNKF